MPSVVDYSDGARFTLRVRSSLNANRRVRWFNTYEFRSTEAGGISALNTLCDQVAAFHSEITYNYVRTDEVTVSTWEPDSHPYNPLGFLTVSYNFLGQIALGTKKPVALRQTLFLKRAVIAGLQGKLFLRGALANEDIEAVDGEWQLVNPSTLETDVNNALTVSALTLTMQGVESTAFYMCMIGDAGATRPIEDFAVAGTSDVKLNHKYFDRAPAAP